MNAAVLERTESEIVKQTAAALKGRGIHTLVVNSADEALQQAQALIPPGVSVMTGGSKTLQQIGFETLLKSSSHPWNNLKEEVLAEKDFAKQGNLRRKALNADYFVGSVQAIAQTGEIVLASAGGSQLAAYAFSSHNIVWVAGIQKIVPTLDDAIRRVREYCLPREDERMKGVGMPGSFIGKLLIFEREPAQLGRKVNLILVNEAVGV